MKKNFLKGCKILGWSMLLTALFIACSDKDNDPSLPEEPDEPTVPTDSTTISGNKEYVSPGKYSLNVVYFIPADRDTIAGWQQRLSGVLLHFQEYYRKNMNYYGYDKTFNLLVNKNDPKDIKITHIQGKQNAADYEAGNLMKEIVDYYREHPEEMSSLHVLVLLPAGEPGMYFGNSTRFNSETDVKDLFFALVCCDNEDLSVEGWENYKEGGKIGPIMHELGHCFRLPHNDTKATDRFFSSLMGYGTHSYTPNNRDNVRFTEADVMWMDQIQVFNTDDKEYYNYLPSVSIDELKLSNDEKNIYLDCRFSSPQKIVGFIAYHDAWIEKDPKKDQSSVEWTEYDALTWCTKELSPKQTAEGYDYQVNMVLPWDAVPITQKERKTDREYDGEVRIRFIFEGGLSQPLMGVSAKGPWNTLYRNPYQITEGGYPDFFIRNQDKKDWKIVSVTSEEKETFNTANKIIDGTKGFCWETAAETTLPQHVVIDAGKEWSLRGFRLEIPVYQGPERSIRAKKVKIEGSRDNENWETLVEEYTMADNSKDIFDIPCEAATARYFRLTILEACNGGDRASLQEFSIIPKQ